MDFLMDMNSDFHSFCAHGLIRNFKTCSIIYLLLDGFNIYKK